MKFVIDGMIDGSVRRRSRSVDERNFNGYRECAGPVKIARSDDHMLWAWPSQ